MARIERVGDLEVSQNLDYQRRMWAVQRVGWALMVLALLAALVGLVGDGPLSDASAGDGGALRVEYPRFARHRAPGTLEFRLTPGDGAQREARVWLNREYLRGVTVETVFPEPASVETGPEGITYVFTLAQPGQPATVIFNLMHETIGRQQGRVRLDDGEPVTFGQFIYP